MGGEHLTRWALYLVRLWGILHRSHQAPASFLGVELRVMPVPRGLVIAVGFVAVGLALWWLAELAAKLVAGAPLQGQALYVLQTINFHHYIVDGLIWKVREKPLRETLGL